MKSEMQFRDLIDRIRSFMMINISLNQAKKYYDRFSKFLEYMLWLRHADSSGICSNVAVL